MPKSRPKATIALASALVLSAVTLVTLHVYADYAVQRHTCKHFGGAWRGFPANECNWAGEQGG